MFFDVTLRIRLVMLVLAATLPLFFLAIAGAVFSTDSTVKEASRNLEFSAALVAANQERVVDSARQVLISIANTPELALGRNPQCQTYFRRMNEQLPQYANLGLISPDGRVMCDGKSPGSGGFAGDRAYFQAALASRDFVSSGYLKGRLSGQAIIAFAMPVLDGQGAIAAVAFAAVSLTEFSRALDSAPVPRGGRLVIADRQGLVLVAKPDSSAMVGEPLPSPTLLAALKSGASGVQEGFDATGARQLYAFLPSGKMADESFFVAVSADMVQVMAPGYQRLSLVLLALTFMAVLGSWLAWRVGKKAIVQPAAKILEATGELRRGRLDVRIPVDGGTPSSEFNRIAESFNDMADALELRERDLARELRLTRQTQEKLLDAQRLGRIGHWEFDTVSQTLSWSQALHELFDLPPDAFDGRHETFLAMLHPDDRQPYLQAREKALRDGTALEVEYRIITPQGQIRWLHQMGKAQSDEPTLRSGVVQEITVRKESELTLARSNGLLLRTGSMAQVGGWEVYLRADHLEAYWSDEIYRIHELEPGQTLEARQALDFYAPEGQVAFRKAIRAAIEETTPWDLELPFITARGRRIWVRTQGRAVLDRVKKVVGLNGALQDITTQHASREHLRLLESSISRLNDIVLITEAEPLDEPGPRMVYVNDAFERRTGYSREEALGQTPRILQGPKTSRAELDRIRQLLQKWQPVRSELINYTKSGDEFWIELDIVPVADASGRFTHWVAVERDITQRKLAEQALLDSEQRYTALFTMAPVPMWVFDSETYRFLTVNEAAVTSYGYSVQEFLAMTIFDIRTEQEAEKLRDLMAIGPVQGLERWEHRRKDGSLFTAQPLAQPVQYGGRACRFVIALDVSEQVRTENEVQEHLFTLQRAADAAQAITWHQTLDGAMQEVVDQARGVIGAHQAVVSLTSDDGLQMIHALSLSEKYASYRGLTQPADGSGIYSMVCEGNRAVRLTQAELEAHPRWRGFGDYADRHPSMRGWLAVPLTGRSGKNIGLLQLSDRYRGEFTRQDEYVAIELAQLASTAIENTKLLEEVNRLNVDLEQKVMQRTAELTRQEALFRALAEQAPQVVWTADPQGRVTFLNRAWSELTGGEPSGWLGNQWMAAVHPDDLAAVHENWKSSQAGGSPFVGIRRLKSRHGHYHTMQYRASPVLDDAGQVTFWVGIDADITEIKAIETALRLSNQELEAFSYSVSHDLRSPLNTIDGFSRLLSKQLAGGLDNKGRHYLSRIQAGVAQMGQLIEDLLSLAQVSRAQLRMERVDLSALARGILEELRQRDPQREVTVHVENDLYATGDGRLLKVVLANLLSNAWKFTSKQPVAEIGVGQSHDAAGLPVFFVRDNGAGFDMAYANKLFVAFQRLHASAEFAGTGIGLATASRVIVRHGGRLWPDAAPGRGATFFFTLPTSPVLV